MDPGGALDRLQTDLGDDLRVFVVVHQDDIDVRYARSDIDRALEGAIAEGAHEAHLRDIATVLLDPGGTAAIRYTPDAIVVGMPAPSDDGTGFLLSLEHAATEAVDEFIDSLLDRGATILQSTASGPTSFTDDGQSPELDD